MSLKNLISRFGRGSITNRQMDKNTGKWTMFKMTNEVNMIHKEGKQSLYFNCLHVRNGSRGNGMGMGHQNKFVKFK